MCTHHATTLKATISSSSTVHSLYDLYKGYSILMQIMSYGLRKTLGLGLGSFLYQPITEYNVETHWILFVLFIPIKFRHLINHVSLDFNLIIAHEVVKETVNNLLTEEEVVL